MKLVEGQVYTFKRIRGKKDGNNRPKIIIEQWKLVKQYPHHAVFEDKNGFTRSFQYWDIDKLLNGGMTES